MTITIPLSDFDPANATEDEINATYKERWAIIAAELETDYCGIPKEIVHALQERGRLDWIAHNEGEEAQLKRIERAARVAEQVSKLEAMGVSDKAPPRRLEGVVEQEAEIRAAVRAGRVAPPIVAVPKPDASGTADDVNAAMRAVFGTSMEDLG